jgi:hypothetical protein
MKLRTGFVSNSSSQSFIVNGRTSLEVFKQMMKVWQKDYEEVWNDCGDVWYSRCKKAIKVFLKDKLSDYNEGIMVPFTINYNTYICPARDGKCRVYTCNNTNWVEGGVCISGYINSEYDIPEDVKFIDICTGIELTAEHHNELESFLYKLRKKEREKELN